MLPPLKLIMAHAPTAKKKAPAGKAAKPDGAIKIIANNRKARFDYDLMERSEAGIVLVGTEVKSLRLGNLNLTDAYCAIDRGAEIFLHEAHISVYANGTHGNHEPRRVRKLLLNKREIRRLAQKVREKGLTIVPTRMYFKRGKAKVEIALAKGRKSFDKSDQIKERDAQRDLKRQLS